ncbi:MAG: DNA photolyase family protein [Rickettsiales bacterium]|jgi:deoxyribodipyrimidine photo-lyase|nr:DNA photolyase family protein [Rickettsiales bacterium]
MLSLLWLRRDLRLEDNLSLYSALQAVDKIQPIFIFDDNILARFTNPNDRRISFIIDALRAMNKELEKKNSEVLVFYGKPEVLIPQISACLKVNKIFAGQDYEPYGMKRDANIAKQVDLELNNDHLLMAPDKVLKDDGNPYKVFTPYFKRWQAVIGLKDYDSYNADDSGRYANSKTLREILAQHDLHPLDLNEDVPGYKYQEVTNWPIDALVDRFNNFLDNKLVNYNEGRNYLAEDRTSCLSPYIRFGLISIRQCYRSAREMKGSWQWIAELAWRDFYAMILYHYPETVSKEMQPQYRNLKWSEDSKLLEKFTLGQTGYPVIDAAIRQLLQEGWMHNRARMIVASFFTKNLWLNWRLGEEFFAQQLMDYELSSNVGGWQWSASTGTDAQPYFRMFNPYLQSKRFDPQGDYIRKYLPELKSLSNKEIHISGLYPPIVDYESSRKKAIESFKKIG